MDEEKKTPETQEAPEAREERDIPVEEAPEAPETAPEPEAEAPEAPDPLEEANEKIKAAEDRYLRLAAEYDNYRKRSQKEKDSLYRDAKADTIKKFLPVFDNLSRALEQETEDAAYKKGVELTMNGLMDILGKLGVTVYGEPGDAFSPEEHNAVMHIEDENYKEGEIVAVFQKGFKLGDKVIRFAMVQTAN